VGPGRPGHSRPGLSRTGHTALRKGPAHTAHRQPRPPQ